MALSTKNIVEIILAVISIVFAIIACAYWWYGKANTKDVNWGGFAFISFMFGFVTFVVVVNEYSL